jgi:hypothetical protein
MSWIVEFYNSKIMDAIDSWPLRMRAKFLLITEIIERFGSAEGGKRE